MASTSFLGEGNIITVWLAIVFHVEGLATRGVEFWRHARFLPEDLGRSLGIR